MTAGRKRGTFVIIYMGRREPSKRQEKVINVAILILDGNSQEGSPEVNPDQHEMHPNFLRYSGKI